MATITGATGTAVTYVGETYAAGTYVTSFATHWIKTTSTNIASDWSCPYKITLHPPEVSQGLTNYLSAMKLLATELDLC